MTLPIAPVTLPIAPIATAPSIGAGSTTGGAAFQAAFTDAISKVETFQHNAAASVNRFLNGEGEELHQVALKGQEADLSFQLFMQVRNKIVTAYQEVMRMQV